MIIALASILALAPPLLFNAPLVPSVYNGLVLLVIGCPCAFTIATPVAMVSALTSASRNGVLIKGSTFIEEMNKAKVFAFDKTGTLTQGKLKVTDVIPYGVSRDELISVAATLYFFRAVVVPFVLAVFLTFCLTPVIDAQMGWLRLPRVVAVVTTVVLGCLVLLLLGLLIAAALGQVADRADEYQPPRPDLYGQPAGLQCGSGKYRPATGNPVATAGERH